MSAVQKDLTVIPSKPPSSALTPMEMLNLAIERGATVEVLEKLMNLQERWEANQGRRAFDNAIAAAKSKLPVIIKTRDVSFGAGRAAYKFEDLATIAKAVDPILAANGLSYRFRTHSEPGNVTVTCIISHKDGHSEENSLSGPNDTSGSKNPMQAIGSSVTYLQRYTLKAALGLASSADTDANVERDIVEAAETIMPDQIKSLEDLVEKVAGKEHAEGLTKATLKHYSGLLKTELTSFADLPVAEFARVVRAIEKKGKSK